jgi:hypothetical protein
VNYTEAMSWGCPGGGTPAQKPLMKRCQEYVAARRATYDMRRERFCAVADVLDSRFNLSDTDIIYDLGAGHCQFDYYLRAERNWRGIYVPIDGHIDGTNLQTWKPKQQPDIYVIMEFVEHLRRPIALLDRLKPRKGIVLTTPNADVTDVLGCDPDHKSIVTRAQLRRLGYSVYANGFFGTPNDTLVGWKASK